MLFKPSFDWILKIVGKSFTLNQKIFFYLDDVIHVRGLLEAVADLPCDTTPPSPENPAMLVVWTKEPAPNPIYT